MLQNTASTLELSSNKHCDSGTTGYRTLSSGKAAGMISSVKKADMNGSQKEIIKNHIYHHQTVSGNKDT